MPICAGWSDASACTGRRRRSTFAATAMVLPPALDRGEEGSDGVVRTEWCPLHLRSGAQQGSRRADISEARRMLRPARDWSMDKVRDFTTTRYAAKSWSRLRRVVARIEATRKTPMSGMSSPTSKEALRSTSTKTSIAPGVGGEPDRTGQEPTRLRPDQLPVLAGNQMRLILRTAAHWLMRTLRDAIPEPQPLASGELSTLRLRLLKSQRGSGRLASRGSGWHSPRIARMPSCSAA